MPETRTEAEQIRELVKFHAVMYEARPHVDVVKFKNESDRVKDSFDLDLYGVRDQAHRDLTPGGDGCIATYGDLRRIAEWILPREERPSICEIESFDQSLHRGGSPKPRFEVRLRITIRHRHGWDQPIDECEKLCLDELVEKLRDAGARRR